VKEVLALREGYVLRVPITFLALCLSLLPRCTEAEIKKMRATLLTEGSVPPAQVLYSCVHELDNKPFSDAQIKSCAEKLRANYFIHDVKVKTTEIKDWWSVEFTLSGESLDLDQFQIYTFDNQESALLAMLSRNNDYTLHMGGIFTIPAESSTYNAISQFYRARGQMVGVVPNVNLDYKQHKALVSLRVVPGPPILPVPLSVPYGEPCGDDHIISISWWDTSDGVPVELVQSGLALRWPLTCFSEELAERDKAYLANLAILTEPLVQYSGAFGDRHIQYKLKAKPLKVEQIEIRGFGDVPAHIENSSPNLLNNLSLRSGDFFSHSAKNKSIEYLKKAFSRNGYWTEVTEREELIGTDALGVTFSVLVFALQTVVVNGREIK
jgi:hypothetical protein